MAALPIPSTCITRMQRLIRNFLWDQGTTPKTHWLSWSKICRPRDEGGLGLRSLQEIRKTCRGKLATNFLCNKNLWAEYIHNRYRLDQRGSKFFEDIKPWMDKLMRDSFWDIGDGSTKLELFCIWLRINLPRGLQNLSLRSVVSDPSKLGELLSLLLPVMHGLFGHMRFTNQPDSLIWKRSVNGSLDSHNFYEEFRKHAPKQKAYNTLWQSWIPMKMSVMAWKVLHGILPTYDNVKNAVFISFQNVFAASKVSRKLWSIYCSIVIYLSVYSPS